MNSPQIEFIEDGLLAYSQEAQAKINKAHISYDPFDLDNFEEAIKNLPNDEIVEYHNLCKLAESADASANKADAIVQQARCHRYLMNCVKAWWIRAEIYNRHPSLEGDC